MAASRHEVLFARAVFPMELCSWSGERVSPTVLFSLGHEPMVGLTPPGVVMFIVALGTDPLLVHRKPEAGPLFHPLKP